MIVAFIIMLLLGIFLGCLDKTPPRRRTYYRYRRRYSSRGLFSGLFRKTKRKQGVMCGPGGHSASRKIK